MQGLHVNMKCSSEGLAGIYVENFPLCCIYDTSEFAS